MTERHDKAVTIPNDFVLATVAAYVSGGDIVAPENCRGLLVGTAGVQDVTMQNGQTRDLIPLTGGITPGRFKAIRSDAGNTAANIFFIV